MLPPPTLFKSILVVLRVMAQTLGNLPLSELHERGNLRKCVWGVCVILPKLFKGNESGPFYARFSICNFFFYFYC